MGLILIGFLGGCHTMGRMKVTHKTRAWEKQNMDPRRRMTTDQRTQAWENERKKRRQSQYIEEGSGGIHHSVGATEVSEDKEVMRRRKKKK